MNTLNTLNAAQETPAAGLASGAAPALAALLSGHVSSSQIQISLFTEADDPVAASPGRPSREVELRKLRKRTVLQEGQLDDYRQRLTTEKRQLDDQRALVRDLQQEKERYTDEYQKHLASRDNVDDALDTLDRKDTQFHRIAVVWACIGALSLAMAGLYFGSLTFLRPAAEAPVTWEYIAFCLSRGVPALAVLGLLAAYAFKLSRSYFRESLRYADRRHAIQYGKLYMDTYGPRIDAPAFKEAFQNWNLRGEDQPAPPSDELGNGPLSIDFTAIAEKLAGAARKPDAWKKER